MITLRQASQRGHANHGWLKSAHTFSFADYYDPKHMGFSVLRVINEDRIDKETGFGTHGHRDMEIISYVIDGELSHKDSMGNETVIKPSEVQRLSAGTGIRHSEHNNSKVGTTHFLQIWIMPAKNDLTPSYDQKSFANSFACSDFVLVGSQTGKDGSVVINQDVDMYIGKSKTEGQKKYDTFTHRKIWVQMIKGRLTASGVKAEAGDGLAIENTAQIDLQWSADTEFILFDLPK